MEEARRKLRVFLICVVVAAVLIGVIYYFTDVYGTSDISEGTLVKGYIYPEHQIAITTDEDFRR